MKIRGVVERDKKSEDSLVRPLDLVSFDTTPVEDRIRRRVSYFRHQY